MSLLAVHVGSQRTPSTGTSYVQTSGCGLVLVKLLTLLAICAELPLHASGQIGYTRRLSDLRIQELHNMASRLEHSINPEKFACDSYFDYVCSRNKPLYSILGHLPEFSELMKLLTELQQDPDEFEAKRKMMDFFISCSSRKGLEDCYRETFEYFKPLFGYIITKNHIDSSSHEHHNFLHILERFLAKAEHTDNFLRNPIRMRLATLKEKFRIPHIYFRPSDLNQEYGPLSIYRESYKHNLRNLELHRRRNSTFVMGVERTMLDWTLYVYQSHSKPMSYYFPTLNVHLWMTLYNSTERLHDPKRVHEIAECLKLPQYVHVLEEARVLAVVYLKSFRNAWQDYRDWITSSNVQQEIFDYENEILKQYHLNNKRIFFTLYAQNFCDFGKELSENIFYLGLKQNLDFFNIYSCGHQTERNVECV